MSTESGGDGADGSGVASILVGMSDAAAGDTAAQESAAAVNAVRQEAETLALRDLLQGAQSEQETDTLGACLSFESVGNSTVISVESDGSGPTGSIPIATIDNVIGVTLQQLLNNEQIIA